MTTKQCTKCGETKPVSEFYRNKAKRDGFQSRCKDCSYVMLKKWREANPKRKKEIDKKWREANPERCKEISRECYQRNREKRDAANRRHYTKYPERMKACKVARRNIPLNDRSCEHCGITGNLHRHHPDYSKPLEVIALCASCHKAIHSISAPAQDPIS